MVAPDLTMDPAWFRLAAWKQIAALPSQKDALDLMVVSYHRVNSADRLVSDVMLETWSASELREVAGRIGVQPKYGAKCAEAMRADIRAVLKSHADTNPHLVEKQLHPSTVLLNGSVPRDRFPPGTDRSTFSPSPIRGLEVDGGDLEERKEEAPVTVIRPKLARASKEKKNVPSVAALGVLAAIPPSPGRKSGRIVSTPRKAVGLKKPSAARQLFKEGHRHRKRSVSVSDSSGSDSDGDESSSSDSSGPGDGDDSSSSSDSDDSVPSDDSSVGVHHSHRSSRRKKSSSKSRIAAQMKLHGLDDPWGKQFIENALRAHGGATGSATLVRVYKDDLDITTKRNRMEILAWCRCIDAMRLGHFEVALEIAVRRLAGVHTAELSGTWEAAAVFELDTSKQSFVPAAALKAALKTVTRSQALKKLGDKPSSSGFGGTNKKVSSSRRDDSYSAGGASASASSALPIRPTRPPLKK